MYEFLNLKQDHQRRGKALAKGTFGNIAGGLATIQMHYLWTMLQTKSNTATTWQMIKFCMSPKGVKEAFRASRLVTWTSVAASASYLGMFQVAREELDLNGHTTVMNTLPALTFVGGSSALIESLLSSGAERNKVKTWDHSKTNRKATLQERVRCFGGTFNKNLSMNTFSIYGLFYTGILIERYFGKPETLSGKLLTSAAKGYIGLTPAHLFFGWTVPLQTRINERPDKSILTHVKEIRSEAPKLGLFIRAFGPSIFFRLMQRSTASTVAFMMIDFVFNNDTPSSQLQKTP